MGENLTPSVLFVGEWKVVGRFGVRRDAGFV